MTTASHTGSTLHTTPATWHAWQNWTTLALGVYLLLAPFWTTGAPTGWFATLGILVAAVALWCLGRPDVAAAEWTQLVLGVVVFLTPWLAGVAGVAAVGWTAWIIGILVAALAGAMLYARRA